MQNANQIRQSESYLKTYDTAHTDGCYMYLYISPGLQTVK